MLKNKYPLLIISLSIFNAYAIGEKESGVNEEFNEIQVTANKFKRQESALDTTESSVPKEELAYTGMNYAYPKEQAGAPIPPIVTGTAADTIHSTTQDLNALPGISILGGNQSMSQNISIGGLNDNNIYVGIDGVNNYLSSDVNNQTNQLLSPYLFKSITASQTGSDITYGSGNLGGAVNFTTLDPEDLLQGDKLSTTSAIGYNSAVNGVNANAALAAKTGNVSYLLDIVGSQANNMQLSNGTTLPYSANNNVQGLAKIMVDISQTQSAKFTFLQMQNQGEYPTVIDTNLKPSNPPANFNFLQNQLTADYRYNPDNPYFDVQLKLYYQTNQSQVSPVNNGGGFAQSQDITMNTSGIKLQNQTNVALQKLLYGLEYTNIQGQNGAYSSTLMSYPNAGQQLYGLFLQDSWDITKQINITAGSRYNSYQSQSGNLNNNGSLFTNEVGLNYKFLPDWLAFAGFTQGFSAPTIQQLYLGGDHPFAGPSPFLTFLPNPNLNPQVGNNKTLGIKYDKKLPYDQYLNLSATAYLNNINNYILLSYVEPSAQVAVAQNINIPEAQIYGYILAASYNSPWFGIDTNFTSANGSTQSSYTSPSGNVIGPGSPLPIPQAKGFIGLNFPIKPIDSKIQTSITYTLNQNSIPPGSAITEVPGYALVGISYAWHPKHAMKNFSVIAGVDNLFNENYVNYNGFNLYPGMARNFYTQATYRY
jgi:hemoglobin/transferrin/lactoferrin receptor protein